MDNFNRFLRDFRVFFTISRQFFVYFLEQLETFHAFPKDDVFAVALLRRAERDEELGAVAIFTGIPHAQDTEFVVFTL